MTKINTDVFFAYAEQGLLKSGDIIFVSDKRRCEGGKKPVLHRRVIKAGQFFGKQTVEKHKILDSFNVDHTLIHAAIVVKYQPYGRIAIRECVWPKCQEVPFYQFKEKNEPDDFFIFRPSFRGIDHFCRTKFINSFVENLLFYTSLGISTGIPYSNVFSVWHTVALKKVDSLKTDIPKSTVCSSFVSWAYNSALLKMLQTGEINLTTFQSFCIPYEKIAPLHLFHELIEKSQSLGLYDLVLEAQKAPTGFMPKSTRTAYV